MRPFFTLTVSWLALVATSITGFAQPRAAPKPEKQTPALERLKWRENETKTRESSGKILVEADDGGLLLLGQDGRLWTIEKPQLVSRENTGKPFRPLTSTALAKELPAELGRGFEVIETKHYVIATSARREYAQWCGALFERLYLSFHKFWKHRGVNLTEPEFPLVALVFAGEQEFAAFATQDAGPDVASAKGYYSIGTNRMVLYDLTAADAKSVGNAADIDRQLAAIPYNIATVIHEATHQIAFNSGMHTRYADNPLWLVEGMAMYFETPDLSSKSGWKTAGAPNDERLAQFRDFLSAGRRKPNSLTTLITSDVRFNDPEQGADAYAEAWALSFWLIRTKEKAYVKYLNTLAAKPQLIFDSPEDRLNEFRAAFGDDLKRIDADLLKSMQRLK